MDDARRVRQCSSKKAYNSEWHALKVLLHREETAGVRGLHIYPCEYCYKFHIGHARKEEVDE